mgnify:CR=1 FL=1
MHLLVLSAFRPVLAELRRILLRRVSMHLLVLSAFRQKRWADDGKPTRVSMHLLVLSAFRQKVNHIEQVVDHTVSMHLLVLSAFRRRDTPSMFS